jgi:predicted O-methyltransferase YrrM
MMATPDDLIATVKAAKPARRDALWTTIINTTNTQSVLELGVWKGQFAEHLLRECPGIAHYVMLDPWRHLDGWNKPANVDEDTFAAHFAEAMARTEFASAKRRVLRGTTLERIDDIPDGSLDLVYVDGDHTLRGISIDLIRSWPKVKPGGILGGDDYTQSIWQHPDTFEPTLVCPFAAYFAESQGAAIAILPFNQFAIFKQAKPENAFRVIDVTGRYGPRTLRQQFITPGSPAGR